MDGRMDKLMVSISLELSGINICRPLIIQLGQRSVFVLLLVDHIEYR